ncbi:unnamed protein product [Cylicocyclus nassatus]|uniref:G-protein coupled receptors family 1 profile domain-containing protein n=1 Tax=Cylicocyclus nassatus TaxID=53992 RepID=A0AA36H2A9_CYLNA|nr:unnamed protein product [Cylicocyclus nassatus]
MALYMFFICQQTITTLMISTEMLAALFFPLCVQHVFGFRFHFSQIFSAEVRLQACNAAAIQHKRYRVLPYISTVVSLCSIYSFCIAFWGWTAANDDIIPFCNPPLALAPHVSRFWSVTNFAICALVVLLYTFSMVLVAVSAKSSSRIRQLKAIRRLQVVVFVFILSWTMASLGSDIGAWIQISPEVLPIWESNLVFFALICYSQTFYVCMWRSSEYRQAFKEQIQIMICKNSKKQPADSIHITVTTKS